MTLPAMIRLADRKGALTGALSPLQEEALQWLIINEMEENVSIERERMKYTILAGNLHLWRELYGEEEEVDEGEIEWVTPQSAEEIEGILQVLQKLEAQNTGSENPSGDI